MSATGRFTPLYGSHPSRKSAVRITDEEVLARWDVPRLLARFPWIARKENLARGPLTLCEPPVIMTAPAQNHRWTTEIMIGAGGREFLIRERDVDTGDLAPGVFEGREARSLTVAVIAANRHLDRLAELRWSMDVLAHGPACGRYDERWILEQVARRYA